ncbi:hypothetical protein DFH08DRAFT_948415 [Mycena albidolilacea]|uniref:F-box domain-containing protein n=1 Tax=Mycena albidolilacea TaxID=1033008 RepID=A0AAD7AQX8_9AGAR|nr:hypothetical protein DFH08DRAFT_948415 [Mycena albidolilacea]
MADTPFTVRVRAAVIEKTEWTRSSSKADIERLIEESESKMTSLESLELGEREHACVAALRYLISPIRTLPVELLTEIFGLAIHDDTHIKDAFRVSQCPNLVRASVSTGLVLSGAARDALSLSHLRSLSVYYSDPAGHAAGHSASFLDNLLAPVLEELCLDFGKLRRSARWTEAHFPAFQLRTPNITGLELQYSTITSDELKDVLYHTLCLERLTLKGCECYFDDTFIDALHYKGGLTPLVPHLHSLVLELMRTNGLADIMASMIASRWWTDIELASNPVPPAVARWTLVQLEGFLEPRFVYIMAGLQRKGIPLEVNAW